MKRFVFFFVLVVFFNSGCEKQEKAATESPPGPQTEPRAVVEKGASKAPLLKTALKAKTFEYPTQALAEWRGFREQQPALVILTQNPFLDPIPKGLQKQAIELTLQGTPEEIERRAALPRANPLLLPSMALSAALRAGLFSEILWVLPSDREPEELNLEAFRRQLIDSGIADRNEAESFTRSKGFFTGTLMGVPFRAAHPRALPEIEVPIICHIDLSYFKPLYKDEIKTPLYPLINRELTALRKTGWQALSATLSLSNATGELALDVRFLGHTLATVFDNPNLLDASMPENWVLRRKALYLENFFKKEEVHSLYRQLEQAAPKDASIKYALYQVDRKRKKGTLALEKLAEAVALDKAYALEYLNLSSLAMERNLPEKAADMLLLAQKAFPANPFIALRAAELLSRSDRSEEAQTLLAKLESLTWSKTYYPRIEARLASLRENLPDASEIPTPSRAGLAEAFRPERR